jgi:hypothetical protein
VASSMGVLGFGIGAVVATALGYSATSEGFWNVALTGAIIGAAFGAAFGNLFLATPEEAGAVGGDVTADEAVSAAEAPSAPDPPDPPKPTNAFRAPITNALRSMAFGGPQSVMIHELQGGSTDSLLLAVSESEAEAAATGVVGGMVSGAVGDALSGTLSASTITGGKLAIAVVSQAALWTFAGVEKQSLGSYVEHSLTPSTAPPAARMSSGYNASTSYYSSGYNPMSNPTPY